MKIITGPTGSGKSSLALKLGGPIFNADAFQFYREIPILSNQPSVSETFHFTADRSLRTPTNAGSFAREALPLLNEPGIWVGMGLYLGAALYGLDEDRAKGTPFQGEARVPYRMIVLHPDRKQLYESINQRVDEMIERGALAEARGVFALLQAGVIERTNPVLKAIGLSHLINHLEGSYTLDQTVTLWKRDTRRLAKRQFTWLRKFCAPSENRRWVDLSSTEVSVVEEFLGQ